MGRTVYRGRKCHNACEEREKCEECSYEEGCKNKRRKGDIWLVREKARCLKAKDRSRI